MYDWPKNDAGYYSWNDCKLVVMDNGKDIGFSHFFYWPSGNVTMGYNRDVEISFLSWGI